MTASPGRASKNRRSKITRNRQQSNPAILLSEVFEELQEIGKGIQDEVQDIGFPAHGDMGGDISKCPYYAAKMAVSGKTTYMCQLAQTLLRRGTAQVLLVTWVAAITGFAAWYLL